MAEEQKPKEGQVQEPPQEVTGQEKQVSPSEPLEIKDVPTLLKETGYKNLSEVVKSDKEKHATITRLSQREKELEAELEDAKAYAASQQTQPPAEPPGQGDIWENPDAVMDKKIDAKLKTERANMLWDQVKADEPEVFDFLWSSGAIQEAYHKSPHKIARGLEGHRAIVKDAKDILRKKTVAMQSIVGNQSATTSGQTEEEIRKKILIEEERAKNAHIPQTTTAQPGITDDTAAEIKKAVDAGDTDKVIALKKEQFDAISQIRVL